MNTKQRRGKLKVGSIAAQCLLEISHATDLWLANAHRPYLAFRYDLEDALEVQEFQREASHQRILRRLEKQKLITLKRLGNIYEAALTNNGIAEALRLQVACVDPLPQGFLCVVVFDVPMTHNRFRKQLRGFLKWAGFTKTQQSVWTSTKDACSILAHLFHVSSINKWVRVYRAVETSYP